MREDAITRPASADTHKEPSASCHESGRGPLTTAERWRRLERDRAAFERRRLWRRSHGRLFHDYLDVIPHVFLQPAAIRAARLLVSPDRLREALRGRAVWTLDTASRIALQVGFLRTGDLTGYATPDVVRAAVEAQWIEPPCAGAIAVDPPFPRPPGLIVHLVDTLPDHTAAPHGDLVVPHERLLCDIFGTLGWRPDLLARLEAARSRQGLPPRDGGPATLADLPA